MICNKKNRCSRLFASIGAVLLASQCMTACPSVLAAEIEDAQIQALYDQYKWEDPERFHEISTLSEDSASASQEVVHDERFDDYMRIDCIDVSKFQGNIDWEAVAADGISQVIIRAGYRGYGEAGVLVQDPMFLTNLEGAASAGLEVGVYFYTQAITEEEAIEEADFVLSILEGFPLSLPVYYDIENVDYDKGRMDSAELTTEELTAHCDVFCSTIEAGGYDAGVYANKNWLTNYLNAAQLAEKYHIWLAEYKTKATYTGDYQMWQYSSKGQVSGISGNVDMDVNYSRKVSYAADGLTLAKIGDTAVPVMSGDGTISYRSSDPLVATVNRNGEVMAVGMGTARVTAVSSNGSSDSIEITVASDTHVVLNYSTMLFTELGDTEVLVSNSDVFWSFSDTQVADIGEDGTVKAVGYGTAELIAEDAEGNKGVCNVIVLENTPESGDINFDGVLNVSDASYLLSYIAHALLGTSGNITQAHYEIYDYDHDGHIDTTDASKLLAYCAACLF